MNNSTPTYTPGYSRAKALMVAWGVLLFVLGLCQLAPALRLVLFGDLAQAEVTAVIKTKTGLPDVALHDDLAITAAAEPHDRSYIFWDEFAFRTRENSEIKVRAPIGSMVKPLDPMLDSDGLPTTELVYYDPRHPGTVVFPHIISTWFIGGMLTFLGLATMAIGSVLYYWSRRPIELPHTLTNSPLNGSQGGDPLL